MESLDAVIGCVRIITASLAVIEIFVAVLGCYVFFHNIAARMVLIALPAGLRRANPR